MTIMTSRSAQGPWYGRVTIHHLWGLILDVHIDSSWSIWIQLVPENINYESMSFNIRLFSKEKRIQVSHVKVDLLAQCLNQKGGADLGFVCFLRVFS